MNATSATRIVIVGVAALFAVQGLVMLGICACTPSAVWRVAIAAVALAAVVPRRYWIRASVGILCLAGASGFLWVLEHTVRPWLERGARPQWEEYGVQAIVLVGYIVPFAIWTISRKR